MTRLRRYTTFTEVFATAECHLVRMFVGEIPDAYDSGEGRTISRVWCLRDKSEPLSYEHYRTFKAALKEMKERSKDFSSEVKSQPDAFAEMLSFAKNLGRVITPDPPLWDQCIGLSESERQPCFTHPTLRFACMKWAGRLKPAGTGKSTLYQYDIESGDLAIVDRKLVCIEPNRSQEVRGQASPVGRSIKHAEPGVGADSR